MSVLSYFRAASARVRIGTVRFRFLFAGGSFASVKGAGRERCAVMADLHVRAGWRQWQPSGQHDARVIATAVAVRGHRGVIFVRDVRKRLSVRADKQHIDVRAAPRRNGCDPLDVAIDKHLPAIGHGMRIRDLCRLPRENFDRCNVRVLAAGECERKVEEPIRVLRFTVEIRSASGEQRGSRKSYVEAGQQMNRCEFYQTWSIKERRTR